MSKLPHYFYGTDELPTNSLYSLNDIGDGIYPNTNSQFTSDITTLLSTDQFSPYTVFGYSNPTLHAPLPHEICNYLINNMDLRYRGGNVTTEQTPEMVDVASLFQVAFGKIYSKLFVKKSFIVVVDPQKIKKD